MDNKFSILNKNDHDNWHTVEAKKHKFYTKHVDYTLEKNQKKILCINMLKNGVCTYGNKCMYAHSLDEQNVDYFKKKVYDIIKSDEIINIDLSHDEKLAKIFLQMTKVCIDCKNKMCPGGYNCKYGTVDEKYKICYDDLMTGNCKNNDCNLIHLTKKGIKPIISNIKYNASRSSCSGSYNKKYFQDMTNCKIINDDFFISLNRDKNISNYDSDNDSIESIEKIKEYLNNYDSDENCDESIFIYKND